MIRLLSLTAALALSPLSCAFAGALASPQEDRAEAAESKACLLYTSPSPRDYAASRMPSSA